MVGDARARPAPLQRGRRRTRVDDTRKRTGGGIPAGIAAHAPDTAAVGFEILAEGGNAADAAVAATLASCVCESMMTGLAGGGHAINFTAATGRIDVLDFFVAVPGLGAEPHHVEPLTVNMVFEDEAVPYDIGPGSVAVPGVPAGCAALSQSFGRLPWRRLIEGPLRVAREGSPLPPSQAGILGMIAPAMTLNEGAAIYAPQGRLLRSGEKLHQPGLVAALELLRDEGAATFYEGTIARLMLDLLNERGAPMTERDLREYTVDRTEPQQVRVGDITVTGRRSLGHTLDTLAALPNLHGTTAPERAVAFARLLAGRPGRHGDTSNVSVVDADGNACVVTTSLGLGSSDWLPGLDIHLNSMLGEHDLISGPLTPGQRVGSMMCPTICVDAEGLTAAAGAAGGSRIRSAMVQVLSGVLLELVEVDEAVRRPRLHVVGTVVHLEPDYPVDAAEALRAEGWVTRVWRSKHHFFGGVSVVARRGACGEPRRDGAALML